MPGLHQGYSTLPTESLFNQEVPKVFGRKLEQISSNRMVDVGFLVTEYFNKYPFVHEAKLLMVPTVIFQLKEIFTINEIPAEIFTDNNLLLNSKDISTFVAQWGFIHLTNSPFYPQSNGYMKHDIQTLIMHQPRLKQHSSYCLEHCSISGGHSWAQSAKPHWYPALPTGWHVSSTKATTPVNYEVIWNILIDRQAVQKAVYDKCRQSRELPPLQKHQEGIYQAGNNY